MFLDAGFYFDVMEITPEAVGIHRFNGDNQKVVHVSTLEDYCQGLKFLHSPPLLFLSISGAVCQVSFSNAGH